MVVPVREILDGIVADARETYPGAVIEYEQSVGGEGAARVVDGELLEVALAELIENAVVHNDADAPQVSVRIASDGGRVRAAVADNGPGIPGEEVEAVGSRTETALDHASGLGLWLVQWTVSLSSGDLSFEENDPRGTVATISLEAA